MKKENKKMRAHPPTREIWVSMEWELWGGAGVHGSAENGKLQFKGDNRWKQDKDAVFTD